jgi:hypothetical protein
LLILDFVAPHSFVAAWVFWVFISEGTKIWPWIPTVPETKNDCADETGSKLLLCSALSEAFVCRVFCED